MEKKYEHWCDDKYKDKESKFDIGIMASKIYTTLEKYLIHDCNKDFMIVFPDSEQDKLARQYVVKKLYNMLDTAERIEQEVISTNSIYTYYDTDYLIRRQGWIRAKSDCYALLAQLKHISTVTLKGTNMQKYVDISADVEKLAEKLKNIMASDNNRKKKQAKKYLD